LVERDGDLLLPCARLCLDHAADEFLAQRGLAYGEQEGRIL
jgi:hypothetical protein